MEVICTKGVKDVFKINPKIYSSMFSLPTEIADKGLKFASGEQLKVIICIFRNPDISRDEIAKKTNLSLSTVGECVDYWIDAGVLKSEKEVAVIKTEKQVERPQQVKMPLPEITFTNPTQDEINRIIKRNGSMKRLFNEAQEIFGSTIGYSMQCTIYSIVHRYGIKPDVANYLLQFAKEIGKTSQSDIIDIAKYWKENDITTLSAADDYIVEAQKALDLFRELAQKTNNDTSAPTFAVLNIFCEWNRWKIKFDLVYKAFEIMKAEKKTGRLVWNNISHMNGTIKKWRNAGMTTVEDVEKGTKLFTSKQSKSKVSKETSFDVDKAEKKAQEGYEDFGTKKRRKRKGA